VSTVGRKVILIDASPILGGSGHRGIGRFIHDLLHGLSETASEWQGQLDIRAVADLRWNGTAEISGDLAALADGSRGRRGTLRSGLKWRRRLFLGGAVRDADLLHIPEAFGTPLVSHPTTVVTCHDLIPLSLPEHYLGGSSLRIAERRRADARRYGRARRIVADSERTKRDIIRLLPIPGDKIDVVRLGVQLHQWRPTPSAVDAQRLAGLSVGQKPFSLFVGYGDARKSIEPMMRALSLVRRELDIELVWAASLPEKEKRRYLQIAEREGFGGHVRFVGYVDDATLAALYRKAAVHLFLSKLEGFGLSVAEAMASGCPVVVARDSGTDEIAGDAAFTVAPDDAEAAASAVLKLIRDPDERARRTALGLSQSRLLDRCIMARDYVQVWRRVLETVRC
jgi:alpha-1,3-rhamnosyl/mannosyltransferase